MPREYVATLCKPGAGDAPDTTDDLAVAPRSDALSLVRPQPEIRGRRSATAKRAKWPRVLVWTPGWKSLTELVFAGVQRVEDGELGGWA